MKIAKLLIALLCAAFVICSIITVGMIINQTVIDALSNDSASALARKTKYQGTARIRVPTTQDEINISYTTFELIAKYLKQEMPEPANIKKEHWTNSEFQAELKKIFPEYNITQHSNLKNSELIDVIFDALSAGNPVIIFHAAETGEEEPQWEMRYTAVISINLPNDRITLNDPLGSTERYSLEKFIKSARFENYNMSFIEKLAFSFKIYSKNTIYIIDLEQE